MSDSFEVAVKSGEVLETSHLVEELQHHSSEMELFPVLIGTHVGYFHDVGGGYHRNEGCHIVNLIHEVQGPESPPNKTRAAEIETHLDGRYFYFEVEDVAEYGDYPDEEYTLSLKVTGYRDGPYAFSDVLKEDCDKRETEHEWEG